LLFICGLATFRYVTLPFRIYDGGEVLLFAAAPWAFLLLREAIERRALLSFAITLLSAAVLFLAKLTGLVVFVSITLTIIAFELVAKRRLTASIIAILAASVMAAIVFQLFWASRGALPSTGTEIQWSWRAILVPIEGVAFSGMGVGALTNWLLVHPSAPIISDASLSSYVLGPLGLGMILWIWHCLRNTRYRSMAMLKRIKMGRQTP
ncbi:unnamed protein product, partial [marine sediment metagenome]